MDKTPRLVRSCLYSLFGVCPLLFFTDLTRNPYYTQIALLNILVPAAWMLWLIDGWKKGEFWWARTALDLPLLSLIGWCFFSWLVSFLRHRPLASPIYSEGGRGVVFLLVNTYLVYAAAVRAPDRALWRRLLWITYFVSIAASAYGVAQYFGIEIIWPRSLNPYGSRPVSTFGNPNFMSSYLVLVIPVMMADLLFQASGLPRIFLLAATFCNAAALLATLTRSSWLGLLVAFGVLGIGLAATFETKQGAALRRWGTALVLGLGLMVAFWPQSRTPAYSATVVGRVLETRKMTQGGYAPASQRFLIWTAAWGMVQDHPFLGKGWGCFELFYPFYQGPLLLQKMFQNFRTHANNAHNEILEYWSQIGTVGLGLVLWLWIVFFRAAASVARRLPEERRAIAWGLAGGVAGLLADNLLNVSAHFAVPALLFWWWAGSALSLDESAIRVRRWAIRSAAQKACLLGAGIILACWMVQSFRLWRHEVLFFKGFKLSKGGHLVAAQQALQSAYRWHPLDVNNNYELGNVEARLNQKEKAASMYQRALDANAGYDEIYFNRGTMLMQMGREEEAMADYRRCLAINPLSREAYNALASLYLKDIPRHGDAAEALFKQGLESFPQDKDLWNNRGYLHTQRRQWEPAYEAYRKAIQIDPEFDLARRNLAAILPRIPQYRDDPILHLDAGLREVERLIQAKRWGEALERVQALSAASPRSYRAHFYAGHIFFSLGRLAEAAAEYEQAVSLQPGGEGAWQNLGVTYDRLGQAEKAERAFRKALALNPANPSVKARLGIR